MMYFINPVKSVLAIILISNNFIKKVKKKTNFNIKNLFTFFLVFLVCISNDYDLTKHLANFFKIFDYKIYKKL